MHLQNQKLKLQSEEVLTLNIVGAGALQGPTSLHLEPKPKAS